MNEKLILSAVIFDSKIEAGKERFFIMLSMLDLKVKGPDAVITETIFPAIDSEDDRTESEQVFDYAVNVAAGNIELDHAEAQPNTQLFDSTGMM